MSARDTARRISEPANFASRAWTLADDDKLRRLVLTGLSVRAIGIRITGPKLRFILERDG